MPEQMALWAQTPDLIPDDLPPAPQPITVKGKHDLDLPAKRAALLAWGAAHDYPEILFGFSDNNTNAILRAGVDRWTNFCNNTDEIYVLNALIRVGETDAND